MRTLFKMFLNVYYLFYNWFYRKEIQERVEVLRKEAEAKAAKIEHLMRAFQQEYHSYISDKVKVKFCKELFIKDYIEKNGHMVFGINYVIGYFFHK